MVGSGWSGIWRHDGNERDHERTEKRARAGTRHQAQPSSNCARAAPRSIAIAVSLGVLVMLFYIVTLVKGPGVLTRPM